MSNRNITINDLDQPDYVPSPQYDPIGYDDGRARVRRPRRTAAPWQLWFTFTLAVLVILGALLWGLYRWLGSEYADNETFRTLARFTLYTVVGASGIGLAGLILSLAFAAFGKATRAGLTDLPGGLPVHSLDILTGWRRQAPKALATETMGQHYGVQHTLADRSQYRNVTSYSPSIHVSYSNKQEGRELEEGEDGSAAVLLPAPVPPFSDLLDGGHIGPDQAGRRQPLIFGYGDAGEALTGDWRQLYSTGLGGLQGSGKTWTAAYLLAQSALNGARLVICDPHAGDAESLAARVAPLRSSFACDIAEDDRAILHALQFADGELQRRKKGHADRTPLIVAIDEWSSLRRGQLAELLPLIVEDFSSEGRKLNCHVMLMGQRWDKASVGDFRNTLASSYVHRMRPDEARMMTGLRASALPADTLQLPPGTAYLLDTRGTLTRVHIPFITPADLREVGERLRARGSEEAEDGRKPSTYFGFQPAQRKPAGNPPETTGKANPESTETPSGRDEATTPETARILALFYEERASVAEIVKRLWPEAASGRAYNERRAYVEGVIRNRGRKAA